MSLIDTYSFPVGEDLDYESDEEVELLKALSDDLEASDLCQDGVLAAIRCLYRIPRPRFDSLDDQSVLAVFYVVAVRSVRGKFIDYLRRTDRQRSVQHLVAPPNEVDHASSDAQDARASVLSLYDRSTGASRTVLQAALELGELDIPSIAAQCGFSRAYIYRVLHSLAAAAKS